MSPKFKAYAADLDSDYFVIEEIELFGNRFLGDELLLNLIQSKEGTFFENNKVVADLKRIIATGYVVPEEIEVRPQKLGENKLKLNFYIPEKNLLKDIVVVGNDGIDDIDIYSEFSDMIGRPQNADLMSNRIKALERKFIEKGYLLSRITDLKLNDDGVLELYITEAKITQVRYQGNEKTKEEYLNHLVVNSQAGSVFNQKKLAKDLRKLQGTGYFTDVDKSILPVGEDEYEVVVRLNEKRAATISIGGGVNSSAGVFGNAAFSYGNLRGRGETLNINALAGSGLGSGNTFANTSDFVRQNQSIRVGTNYTIPYVFGSQYQLRPFVNFLKGPNFMVDLSEQTSVTTGTTLARRLDKQNSFSLSTSFSYADLDDEDRDEYISEVVDNILEIDGFTRKNKTQLRAARREANALRDEQFDDGAYWDFNMAYRYNELFGQKKARDGVKARFAIAPSIGMGDISSFTRATGSATKYFPLKWNSTFLLNARGGYTAVGELPQFRKFRLGQGGGVRGYRNISDLGVGNEWGVVTAELRTPIYNFVPALKKWSWVENIDFALFADAGIIGGDERLNEVTDRLSRAASVGFGFRVNIPLVGGLRVDMGFPLIEALTGDRFYRINFGPSDAF